MARINLKSYDHWTVNEARGTATQVCGRCHGCGQFAHFGTCFRCNGVGRLRTISIEEYQVVKAAQDERDRKRREKEEHAQDLSVPFREEWNYLSLLCFKAFTIMRVRGERVDPEIYRCMKGWFPLKGKWQRQETWMKKFDQVKAPVIAALGNLPVGWDDYVAPPPELEYESQWVGEIGQRCEFKVTVHKVLSFDSRYGTTYITIMTDEIGNNIVWKGSTTLQDTEEGDQCTIKGSIKDHAIYTDRRSGEERKQTLLQRCSLIENHSAKEVANG